MLLLRRSVAIENRMTGLMLPVRSTPTPSSIQRLLRDGADAEHLPLPGIETYIQPLLMDGADAQQLPLPGIETYLASSLAASRHRIDSRTGRELGLPALGPGAAGRCTNHDFCRKTQRLVAVVHT
jgi:hypothetical protein